MAYKFPQEIWDSISKGLTSFELRQLVPFGKRLTHREGSHHTIWNKIIKDQNWLDAMTALGLNPILIGPNIRRPTYLCLVVNDRTGDAQFEYEKLLASLRPISSSSGKEFVIKNGITLNIFDAAYNPCYIKVRPNRLFIGERHRRLRTQYVYWNDDSFQIGKITHEDIRACLWMDGKPLLRASDGQFECEITLPEPDHHLPKQRPCKINLQAMDHVRDALGG